MEDLDALYDFWFNNDEVWFNSSKENDCKITSLFYDLYINYEDVECNTILTKKNKIAFILLNDQIVRHIFRDDEKIQYHLTKIIPFVESVYNEFKNDLNPNEFSFVLLPLRHTKLFDKIKFVINETWKKIMDTNGENVQYKRFLTATYERYIRDSNDFNNLQLLFDGSSGEYGKMINYDKYVDILDENVSIGPIINSKINVDHDINKDLCYVLSLSGGVDSMVTSLMLKQQDINFCAVHINYANRHECSNEVDMITEWCKILRIKLYVRTINEINRPLCMKYKMREIYETYTRDIRFKTYCNAYIDSFGESSKINIILGHNRDDCFENILTNISSNSHYDNLRGMDHETTLLFTKFITPKHLIFFRPLLNVNKAEIYNFAKSNNVPYFVDSTPKWSQRGKIRDIVKPCLTSWNSCMTDAFFKLSDNLSMHNRFMNSMCDMFVNNIKINGQMTVNITDEIMDKIVWKMIFNKLGINITDKTLAVFYERLLWIKRNFPKIEINKINKHVMNGTTIIKWKKNSSATFQLLF